MLLAAFTLVLAIGLPSVSAHSGDVLSGYGTPTLDGIISPGEYDSCSGPISQVSIGRDATTDEYTERTYTFTICAANDSENTYYAVTISDVTEDETDRAEFLFDNDHDGAAVSCEGEVEDGLGYAGLSGFLDRNYCFPFWVPASDSHQDVAGVRLVTDVGSVYELSHPLDSGDPEDYTLSLGGTVGWCFLYEDGSHLGTITFPSDCLHGLSTGDASGWPHIEVVDNGEIPVAIYGVILVAAAAAAFALIYVMRRRRK